MARGEVDRPSWNPLRCGGTALPPELLLMAKLVALALLLTGHVRLMPEPFLSFLPWIEGLMPPAAFKLTLQVVFVGAALALLFNRSVRLSSLVLGLTILLAVTASKAYYGNNKTMCGTLLFLTGLYHPRTGPWLLRAQLVIVYFGAGLNKLLDPDWQTGVFFDHWASHRLEQPLYIWAAALLPPLALGKLMCWMTAAVELGLAAAFCVPRWYPAAIWVSLLFHASLLEFTGQTFTMFFYAMESAMLAFAAWPREKIAIYDGDCGICNRIRAALERLDFDRAFEWRTLQSGIGERFGIARAALEKEMYFVAGGRIYAGFRAVKMILLTLPVFHLAVVALIAAPPAGWGWYRRVVVAALLAFFFPMFNPIGQWAYAWVARNRYRFSSDGACAVEPGFPKRAAAPEAGRE